MKIAVKQISKEQEELVAVYCHEVSDEVREIVGFVKSLQGQLTGSMDGREYEIAITDIYYVESVDNRTYLYVANKVYETKMKLYELENTLGNKRFMRASKSVILNLMKVRSIKPAMNGRFTAVLQSGEEIIISRKYVPDLKEKIRGGK